jgi:hypothetical protein
MPQVIRRCERIVTSSTFVTNSLIEAKSEVRKKGKVAEQAFMRYMQAKFGRLKKDEDGQIDVPKVTYPPSRPVTFSALGR